MTSRDRHVLQVVLDQIDVSRGGYILSTACSVPPHALPENIRRLARAAKGAA